jgi:hypothetical protein
MAMRFMMIVKCDKDSEAGMPPNEELMHAIAKLAEEEMKAGILLEQGGLLPSSAGARIRAAGGRLAVTDGPFAEAKELVGGFAILRANSKAEAIEKGKRFMQIHVDILGPDYEGELEVRQMFDPPDVAEGAPHA